MQVLAARLKLFQAMFRWIEDFWRSVKDRYGPEQQHNQGDAVWACSKLVLLRDERVSGKQSVRSPDRRHILVIGNHNIYSSKKCYIRLWLSA